MYTSYSTTFYIHNVTINHCSVFFCFSVISPSLPFAVCGVGAAPRAQSRACMSVRLRHSQHRNQLAAHSRRERNRVDVCEREGRDVLRGFDGLLDGLGCPLRKRSLIFGAKSAMDWTN